MGKTWDSFVPGPKVWAECLRVLKPGGHLVAFFGTRTVDLGGMAIRLAGFEIRDCLAWMYGSGFPKSLDVSKAIDRAAGAEREVVGERITGAALSREASAVDLETGGTDFGSGQNLVAVTAPATEAARQWQGWGTALKPAFEPVILARKPLTGTVAANVQEFGTGALNVDGCRVEHADEDDLAVSLAKNPGRDDTVTSGTYGADRPQQSVNTSGRWPANVILDEEAGAMLDEQTGELPGGNYPAQRGEGVATGFGAGRPTEGGARSMGDTGGASRFFYTAKASRAERSAGLGELPRRITNEATPPGTKGSNSPRAGANRSGAAANHHPTVKPIDLMRYLVRLVTLPGGTVLDPFTGSGTTGIAAGLEGFDFVGIEREAEYREIAEARLKWWSKQEGETVEILRRAGLAEREREKHQEVGQTSLFETEAA